jgi:hypothetical protein
MAVPWIDRAGRTSLASIAKSKHAVSWRLQKQSASPVGDRKAPQPTLAELMNGIALVSSDQLFEGGDLVAQAFA